MKMVGERPLNAVIDPVAEVRKAKIREAFEKATVKCKAGGAPPPKAAPPSKPAAAPAKKAPGAKAKPASPVQDELLDDVEPPKKVAKPPARLVSIFLSYRCFELRYIL